MTDQDFTGKVAFVTGAGSGIGAEVASRLAAAGASVMVSDIKAETAQAVAEKIIANGGKAASVVANTADYDAMAAAVKATVDEFGGLHVAMNNAGISGTFAPVGEMTPEEWRRVIDINLSGVFYGLRHQIPAIVASGGGAVVNVSSILGLVGRQNAGAYIAAKHGVSGLTKAAALDYAAQGVRVNSIHPGYIETPLLNAINTEERKGLASLHPIGRLGRIEEVTNLTLFLLSDQATFITGSQHVVDGGYTAQ